MLEVGLPNDSRFAVRTSPLMAQRKLIDAEDTDVPLRKMGARCAAESSKTKNDDIVGGGHGSIPGRTNGQNDSVSESVCAGDACQPC